MHRPHGIYLFATLTCSVMLAALAYVFVSAVDPLFLLDGNQLSDRNYIFNERISKAAFYSHHDTDPDCIILGSSRMTYLDGRALGGCANHSFSGALPSEIALYSEYLRAMGVRPRRVIVGVDRFGAQKGAIELPEFITEKRPVGDALDYYLSLDLLVFSLKTVSGFDKSVNYYDRRMRKHIDFSALSEIRLDVPFYVTKDDLEIEGFPALAHYRRLRAIFPEAQLIGVIPPISRRAWSELRDPAVRSRYIAGLITYGAVFDELHDLSLLEDPCADALHTYDGTHYSAELWDELGAKITARERMLEISIDDTPVRESLDRQYTEALHSIDASACGAEGQPAQPLLSFNYPYAPASSSSLGRPAGRISTARRVIASIFPLKYSLPSTAS